MKLFLASEAKHPFSIEKLREFVGGFEDKTIAYIPTAANGERWGSWREGGSWNLVQTLGAKIDLVQLEEHTQSSIVPAVVGRDIIWFAGGYCGYLMYWIRRTQLDKHLPNILEKGSIYVGSSAGSMITGKTLDVAEWYPGENETGVSVIPGLDLVDFDIYPHYHESALDHIKQNYKGKRLYLLKNGEEVIVDNGIVQIIGEERVISGN
jgi:dipeptidase E